jgi:Protein of unknown function (DUF1376)
LQQEGFVYDVPLDPQRARDPCAATIAHTVIVVPAPPAFQFYASDFIASTADMTCREVGAYIRLLCYQWEHGGIPNNLAKVARITGDHDYQLTAFFRSLGVDAPATRGRAAEKNLCGAKISNLCGAKISPRLKPGADGLLRHPRLERVRTASLAFSESRKGGGDARAETATRDLRGRLSPASDQLSDLRTPYVRTKEQKNRALKTARDTPQDTDEVGPDAGSRPADDRRRHWYRARSRGTTDTGQPVVPVIAALVRSLLARPPPPAIAVDAGGHVDPVDLREYVKGACARHNLAYTGRAVDDAIARALHQVRLGVR